MQITPPKINDREHIFAKNSPLANLAKAAAIDSHRARLNGVYITADGKNAIATDGLRMHVLPIAAAEQLRGKIFANPKSIKKAYNKPYPTHEYPNGEVQDYPVDWENVYDNPKAQYFHCQANTPEVIKESAAQIKNAREKVRAETPPDIRNRNAVITREMHDYELVSVIIGETQILFDRKQLMDCLSHINDNGENIRIGITGEMEPVFFHNDFTGARAVIMPVRDNNIPHAELEKRGCALNLQAADQISAKNKLAETLAAAATA